MSENHTFMELIFLFSTFSSSILEPNLQIGEKIYNLDVMTQTFFKLQKEMKKKSSALGTN